MSASKNSSVSVGPETYRQILACADRLRTGTSRGSPKAVVERAMNAYYLEALRDDPELADYATTPEPEKPETGPTPRASRGRETEGMGGCVRRPTQAAGDGREADGGSGR